MIDAEAGSELYPEVFSVEGSPGAESVRTHRHRIAPLPDDERAFTVPEPLRRAGYRGVHRSPRIARGAM